MSTQGGDHWCELTLGWALFPVAEDFELMASQSWGRSPFLGWGSVVRGTLVLVASDHTGICKLSVCLYPGTYISKAYSSVNGATWQVVQWYSLFIQQQSQHSFSCFYGPYATQKIWEIAWGEGLFFFFTIFILPLFPTMLGTREPRDLACSCVLSGRQRREIHCFLVSQIFQDGLYKAQRSNQYLSPSNSICPFFFGFHLGLGNQHLIWIRTKPDFPDILWSYLKTKDFTLVFHLCYDSPSFLEINVTCFLCGVNLGKNHGLRKK